MFIYIGNGRCTFYLSAQALDQALDGAVTALPPVAMAGARQVLFQDQDAYPICRVQMLESAMPVYAFLIRCQPLQVEEEGRRLHIQRDSKKNKCIG